MMQWIAETLVATTLLMLLVLAIRPFVADRFGARAAYLLWFAPALRMILPPLPADWFGDRAAAVQDVVVVLAGSSSPSLQPAATTGGGTAWLIASLTIWLGGAVLFFGRHWINYLRFSRDVVEDGRALFDAGSIPVTASSAVSSPIALGVFGKSVIVPTDFEHRYDAAERRLAVAHELTHHDRHDVPVNFAALAILALHWWNPVAHIAHRAFRLDQEAACDAIVLNGATPDERHAYGSALFKSAMGQVPLAACAMGPTTTLKARLRRIVSGKAESRLARPGAALAAFLVLGGVAATASGSVRDAVEPALFIPNPLASRPGLVLATAVVPASGHSEAACPDARRHARERAAHARQAAHSRAMADAAKAVAEVARAEADSQSEIQTAMIEARAAAREAMTEARAAIDEAMAEAQAARAEAVTAISSARREAARAHAITVSCEGKSGSGQASVDTVTDENGHKRMRITVCGANASMTHARIVEALRATRVQIAKDSGMPAEARDRVISALDRQIAAFQPEQPLTFQ
jgi:beta-lactamase regulating signal transducer with metallopeptidase domain